MHTAAPLPKNRPLRILVAGAHPDDPESACGGAIARYAQAGHEVVCLYATRGEAGISGVPHDEAARIRTAEAEAACRLLGARPVFLGQIDGATELNAARYDEAARLIEAEAPDVAFTHWPVDTHRDHRVTSMLVYDAWLRLDRPFALFFFETLTGEQTQAFHPTHYVDIAATEAIKHRACLLHESQKADEYFYPLHAQMHRLRGMEAGMPAAEAYAQHPQSRGSEGASLPGL